MPAAPDPPKPRKRWLPRLRFSLRTLLILVLLIGSAGGLWWRGEPWAILWSVPIKSHDFKAQEFSPDGYLLLATDQISLSNEGDFRALFHVLDTNTGSEKWTYTDPSEHGNFVVSPAFSPDGRAVIVCRYGHSESGYKRFLLHADNGEQIDGKNDKYIPSESVLGKSPIEIVVRAQLSDGQRRAALMRKPLSILDMDEGELFHSDLPVGEMETYSIQPFFAADGRMLTQYDHTWLGLWIRRRPEYWWGVAWLPESWLTALFAGALGWSVWRDWKRIA